MPWRGRVVACVAPVLGMLLLAGSAPAHAGLVGIGPEVQITAVGEAPGAMHVYDVNGDTGHYAVCYASGGSQITCRRHDAAHQPLGPIVHAEHPGVNLQTLDASLAANGDLYIVVMTQNPMNGSRRPVLHGWALDGSLLMNFEVDALLLVDASVAATEDGPWVATGSILPSGPPDRIQFTARRYSRSGVLAEPAHVLGNYVIPVGLTCTAFDQESDIAANRVGDVSMVWIRPGSVSHCSGTVMARTMRAGGFLSSERQLSAVIRDGGGHDVSPNRRPHASALADGRFVLSWSNDAASVTSVIGPTATVLVPESVMMPGGSFVFSANPANGDYAAVVRGTDPQCLQAQLAFEAALVPVTRFDVGACTGVAAFSHQFLADGALSVARVYGGNRITLSRIELPAQIEVNNVTVSEGDPAPGASPVAGISVSLTRPHPNGEDVQVSYVTRNGSAVAGQDFAFTRDTTVFDGSVGQTLGSVFIPLLPDTRYEDDEHFSVDFELPVNAVIRRGEERANIVILDDDDTPPIAPDCDADEPLQCRTVPEPGPGASIEATILLQMAEAVGSDLQIGYTTLDGTATAGSDYVARSGTVQIIAGATSAAIPLIVLGDDLPENTETFRLRLNAPPAVSLSADDLVIHILDDAICFLEVTPPAIVANSPGGDEVLQVTTREGCTWSASSGDGWIHVLPPGNGTGSGALTLQIDPFTEPGVFERSGSVSVTLDDPAQSIIVPVDQDGACEFEIDQAGHHFGVAGGEFSVAVQASVPECTWEVLSPAPWITILSPVGPVSGDGVVRYRVDAHADLPNVEAGVRGAVLQSEQFQHAVSQDGCSYAIDPTELGSAAAGNVSLIVDLDAPAVCRWTALSHASWILIQDGASGSGEGEAEIFVLDNPTVQPRIGTVSLGDETLTVSQQGLDCDHALDPAALAACPDGRVFQLEVSATDGCTWTLHPDADWIDLGATGGEGPQTVAGAIDASPGEASRSATVQLRAQNIGVASTVISQEGYFTLEDFGVRPAGWQYTPDAAWTVSGGALRGAAASMGSASAIDPSALCSTCRIEATVAVGTAASAPGEVLSVLGWYQDAGRHAGLAMDEFSNRWSLFQVVNGTRFSVAADVAKVLPNADYAIDLSFDGTTFRAAVDGQALLQMPLQGPAPQGAIGFRLDGVSARMSGLRVSLLQADATVADPEHIFAAGFEPVAAPSASSCRLIE